MNVLELKRLGKGLVNLVIKNLDGTEELDRKRVMILNITDLKLNYSIVDYKDLETGLTHKLMVSDKGIGFQESRKMEFVQLTELEGLKKLIPNHLSPYEQPIWMSGYLAYKKRINEALSEESIIDLVREFRAGFNDDRMFTDSVANSFLRGLNALKTKLKSV